MAGLFDEQYPALPLAGAGPDRSGLFTEAFAGYQPPSPDYVGQVAARVRGLLGLLQPSQWQEQLGPAAWEALAPQLEQRAARAQAPGESPGYQEMMDLALNFGPGPMGLLGQIVHHGGPRNEMGRRLAKDQGLLPETIPDELPSWAPAERMTQWRTARANAALPVEQGGL
ncbi:MAG: hypothetical protein NHG36_15230, partial [Chromatiaceae bacterium]|nr:hypothetical protein [Candidatus Thioaporhodococcus sediminis]